MLEQGWKVLDKLQTLAFFRCIYASLFFSLHLYLISFLLSMFLWSLFSVSHLLPIYLNVCISFIFDSTNSFFFLSNSDRNLKLKYILNNFKYLLKVILIILFFI